MREYTNRLLEMIEEDLVDPIKVVEMCLNYMSEDEVKDMCQSNDLSDYMFGSEDDEDEDLTDEDDDRSELPWDYGKHFD
jgi:hypothetical protein